MYLEGFWTLSGGSFGSVAMVSGGCLEHGGKVFGGHMKGYLEGQMSKSYNTQTMVYKFLIESGKERFGKVSSCVEGILLDPSFFHLNFLFNLTFIGQLFLNHNTFLFT